MEFLIASSIIGLGYIYQNNKEKKTFKQSRKSKISNNQKPSSYNYYTSHRAYNIWENEQKRANKLLDKSKFPQDTNIVTPGPPYPIIYNKVDYTDKTLPVEFNKNQKFEDILVDNLNNKEPPMVDKVVSNDSIPESGGWQGVSLTGNPVDPNTFTHNNMQPFFGSGVKQNVDEYSTRGIFENFTGTNDIYQKKQEQKQFFQPQRNMSNVYGKQNLDGYMLDRYYVTNLRENETPVEKVYVGPGLNQGYTNEPSGGFQQADTRNYILPKTTNEIRVKTNPKITYYSRINPGEKIAKPGKIGTVYKNNPDTFYVQNPDRYFTTTGQVMAPEQRPCIVKKYTNRKTTELKTRTGSAAPTRGTVAQVRSKYKVSNKVTYKYDDPVNKNSNNQWSILNIFNNKAPNDYGKKTIRLRNNKKLPSKNKNTEINYKSPNELAASRSNQKVKHPKKYSLIKNKRNGNLGGSYKNVVYDPNDVARTTIKEQNIDNNFRSNVGVDTRGNVVYDPNSIARTTIKEQNIDNNFRSNVGVDTRGNVVYDPNSIARTTIKEQNIDNNFRSNVGVDTRGNVVYNPNSIARTTIKEQNIDNNHEGNVGDGKRATYARNEEKAKKTIKQGTMIKNAMGIATEIRNDAHLTTDVQAPGTQRMSTSVEYFGTEDGPELGAYEVTEVEAPNTKKQETSDIEYIGNAGNDGRNDAPMSYEDIYNSTIKAIRGDIDEGYTPGASGPSKIVSGNDVHATTNKLNEIQNQYLNERGVQSNKVYNSIPQLQKTNVTTDKDTVPNAPIADRINGDIVKAFQENPYTQSLKSWA